MTGDEHFSDDDARAAWNLGAEAWDEFVESGADYYRWEVHGPALLRACGDVAGLDVLDLGCGQGFFTRQLARAGASVVGADIADALLATGVEREAREPLGIVYHRVSAARVAAALPGARFDLATACMSLQDMADVGGVLRGVASLLRSGGRLVFSVPHPASDTPVREWERDATGRKLVLRVDRYFETGPAITRWTMARLRSRWETPYWRRTLEEWSELVSEAGFLVRRMWEPRPTPEQRARLPALDDCARVPYFLVFDVVPDAGRAPGN